MQRFNPKKVNEVENKVQRRFEISNRSTALKNVDSGLDINRTWKNISEYKIFQPKRV
jgi:hypothetical protein